jgi:hypothetical protein
MTCDSDETDIGRFLLTPELRRLSGPRLRGGGGGKIIGEAALFDEKDAPESRIDVPELKGDATPAWALTGGLVCVSGEMEVAAEDRIADVEVEVVRWLLGGEYGGGGAGTPSTQKLSICPTWRLQHSNLPAEHHFGCQSAMNDSSLMSIPKDCKARRKLTLTPWETLLLTLQRAKLSGAQGDSERRGSRANSWTMGSADDVLNGEGGLLSARAAEQHCRDAGSLVEDRRRGAVEEEGDSEKGWKHIGLPHTATRGDYAKVSNALRLSRNGLCRSYLDMLVIHLGDRESQPTIVESCMA